MRAQSTFIKSRDMKIQRVRKRERERTSVELFLLVGKSVQKSKTAGRTAKIDAETATAHCQCHRSAAPPLA